MTQAVVGEITGLVVKIAGSVVPIGAIILEILGAILKNNAPPPGHSKTA